MMEEPQKTPPIFCFRCGDDIPGRKDIAATFDGNFHRWDERLMGRALFHLCKKCLEATDMFLDDEQREAMKAIKKMNGEGWQ
jgi:hypothetical protein